MPRFHTGWIVFDCHELADHHWAMKVLHLFYQWRHSTLFFQAGEVLHQHSALTSQACEGLHQLWALSWLLSIALLFRHIFTASATVLSVHFLPTVVFYLTFFPHIFATTFFNQGFPESQQFVLEICRTSCWSSKHSPGLSFFFLVIYIYTIFMGDTVSYLYLFIQAVRPVSTLCYILTFQLGLLFRVVVVICIIASCLWLQYQFRLEWS